MWKALSFAGLVVTLACGSSTSAVTSMAWAINNPNFDNGLVDWSASGNVVIVGVDILPGIAHAAVITSDQNVTSSLSQELRISRATNLGIGYWQSGPSAGTLLVSIAQNGNILVASGQGGEGVAGSSLHAQAAVQPGTVTITLYIDLPSQQGSGFSSSAQVSGFYLVNDAPAAIPLRTKH